LLVADELFEMRPTTAAARAGATGFRDLIAALCAVANHRSNNAVAHLHAVTDDHCQPVLRLLLDSAATLKKP
jgi:hypothetical protein